MRLKLEEIRDEFRLRMIEAEQSRKNSVEVVYRIKDIRSVYDLTFFSVLYLSTSCLS
jgi:hypothetical protein